MTIPVYIVDDDTHARERMLYLCREFFENKIQVVGNSSDPQEALVQIPLLKPEILFLDIEMPGMTGLELAHKLQNKGFKGKIIFVSAFGHYSIKAIKTNAFDYILKPVDVDELKQSIERYKSKISNELDSKIAMNFDLSKREIELIRYLSKGLSSEEIAEEMFLSRHTIDTHRRNILSKTGVRNTIELLNLLSRH